MTTIPETLALAIQHHQAGRLPDAEALYREILQAQPQHADALHLLGLIAYQSGKPQQAVDLIRRAIELDGQQAIYHCNLGEAYRALRLHAEAISCQRRALQLQPVYAEAHYNQALAERDLGNLARATASYRRALQVRPQYAEALINLGAALHLQGQLDEAMDCYRQALALQPQRAEVHYNLGIALQERGQHVPAIASLQEALKLRADYPEAWLTLGVSQERLRDFAAAQASYQRALQDRPHYPEAYNNLGNVLRELGRCEEAIGYYRRAIAGRPDYAEAHNNLGTALKSEGLLQAAIACHERAVQLMPFLPEARFDRGLMQLLQGDWEQGWVEYEWRNKIRGIEPRLFPQPLWDGRALDGRTILLHAEQGLGDTLQFIRYAPLVKQRGGRVLVECQAELAPLLTHAAGIDQLLARGTPLPPFDLQAPLLSLPRILHTTRDNVPADVPYLAASPALVQRWGEKLRDVHGFRVGIAWQGNPLNRHDRQRSMPLAHFAPLAAVEGVRLVSLQKGPGVEQLPQVADRFEVLQWTDELDETAGVFMDTAAMLQHLDLVIAADTSIVHLAGALGVPVWVPLSYLPDWRYMLRRDDSPWYPTMRLFRQKVAGQWPAVFAEMAQALRQRRSEGLSRRGVGPAVVAPAGKPAAAARGEAADANAYRRASLAVDLIPAGAVVLDLDGRAPLLKSLLPYGARYQACQRIACAAGMASAAFDPAACCREKGATHILALGALESTEDLPELLQHLRACQLPVILSYHPATPSSSSSPERAARGWRNHLSLDELRNLLGAIGFSVTNSLTVAADEMLLRLAPRPHVSPVTRRVAVLSFLNAGNFGDRLGYFLINRVLPEQATIHHCHFDVRDGYRPANVPEEDIDLLVLGIGNSLFDPVLTDELLRLLDRVPHAVGIFGTQYRQYIDAGRLGAVLDRLDTWYARYEADALLFGRGRTNVVHLGDWLMDAFVMTRGESQETLSIGDEIWEQRPLDRTIQEIQSYRRVFSTRLHPLLCALTSAEEVAYREQRDMPLPSGKFRSALMDIFGRHYPEEQYFPVDRDAVTAYKTRVRAGIVQVRMRLADLLKLPMTMPALPGLDSLTLPLGKANDVAP